MTDDGDRSWRCSNGSVRHSPSVIRYSSSIPILLAQARRQAKDELGTLELVEPLGSGQGDGILGGGNAAGRARGAKLVDGELAIDRQRPFAVTADLVAIFAQEHNYRHAPAGVDREGVGHVRARISVKEPKVNRLRCPRVVVERGAL